MLRKLLVHTKMHPLRRRLQQEPYCRFQSFEELALASKWGVRIEANKASVDEWLRLPGISIHQARSLVKLTQSGLVFNCIEDVAAALRMPLQQIEGWTAVLQFCYYSSNILEPKAINVNTASALQLATVPAIDLVLARSIIFERKVAFYQDLADLQQRLHLSADLTAELLHYLSF